MSCYFHVAGMLHTDDRKDFKSHNLKFDFNLGGGGGIPIFPIPISRKSIFISS